MMKSLASGSLSALALLLTIASGGNAVAAPATLAQATSPSGTSTDSQTATQTVRNQTQPVTLVQIARQGLLVKQGIPSNGDLIYAAQTGQITAEDLVQAGIKAGQVSSEALQDEGYLNGVRDQLYDLSVFSVSSSTGD